MNAEPLTSDRHERARAPGAAARDTDRAQPRRWWLPGGGSHLERKVTRRDATFRRWLMGADVLAALAAIYATVVVIGDDRVRLTMALAAPIAVIAGKLIGLYDRDELVLNKTTLDESPALFQLATLYTLCIWLLDGFLVQGTLGNQQVLGIWASLFGFALVGRWLARYAASARAPRERCLVVGDLAGTGVIGRRLRDERSLKATLVAMLPMDLERDHERALRRLHQAIAKHDVDRVILAPRTADSEAVLDAIRLVKSLDVKVSLLPRLLEVVGSSVVFDHVSGATLLGVRRFGLTPFSACLKRALDLTVAAAGLFVAGPLMLAIAAAIRLDSPGPVFFRQVRVGRGGRHFEMLKFRTMVDGAEGMKAQLRERNESEGLFKIAQDPRVTRVGQLLRRTSLDELPQLLNVLRGHMSLVGPRPLVVDEDALVHGWHRRRLHLTPGITGPWQLLGSKRVPLDEMVKIDYLYIANWSFWIDLKIIIRTAIHMVRAADV